MLPNVSRTGRDTKTGSIWLRKACPLPFNPGRANRGGAWSTPTGHPLTKIITFRREKGIFKGPDCSNGLLAVRTITEPFNPGKEDERVGVSRVPDRERDIRSLLG